MPEVTRVSIHFIEVSQLAGQLAGQLLIHNGCPGIEGFQNKPGTSRLGLPLCSFGGFCHIAKIRDPNILGLTEIRSTCPVQISPKTFDEIVKKTGGEMTIYRNVPAEW